MSVFSATERSLVRRLARASPTISPRARARLFAGFLTANLALALLPAARWDRWGLIDPEASWIEQLEANIEETPANLYNAVLWGAVAVLAAAQVIRSPSRRRWLWRLSWLSMALIAALIAGEDGFSLIDKDRAGHLLQLRQVSFDANWLALAAPPLVIPLVAAGWVLVTSQRGRPAYLLLTGLAFALAVGSIAIDTKVLYVEVSTWEYFLEEGVELMAGALFVVILAETLAHPVPHATASLAWRRVDLLAATLGLALLAAIPYVLVTKSGGVIEEARGVDRPWSYTGPVSLVEQRFHVSYAHLHRIDVWAFVDGPPGSAEIFARLTPEGAERPIRESRAVVDAGRFSNATASFHFEPIPDSAGTLYTLAVGVLSGPRTYVFLGLTSGDVIPEGHVVVNGTPTLHANDLAMRPASIGSLGETLLSRLRNSWGLSPA